MKNVIQELDLAPSDVTVITPKVISGVIEEIRRHKRVWAQFYKTNRDLVNNGGKEIEFPKKESGITATFDVSAGTGISASNMTYSAVTITVKKGGIGLGFQGEAIRQANRDVLADAIKEAGEVWADTLDIVALEAMFPSVTVAETSGASTVAASFPVVGIKSYNGGFSKIINYASSSSIVFTNKGTVTYWYAPQTNAEGDTIGARRITSTAGSFSAKDILNARSDIIANKFEPEVLVIHPDVLTDILYDPTVKFLEKSVYKGEGELYNAELGRIWDLRVIVSNKCPRYAAVLIDPGDLGYEVIRKDLKLVRDEYSGMSMDVLYFWGFGELNYGVVNAQAYGVVAMQGTLTEAN